MNSPKTGDPSSAEATSSAGGGVGPEEPQTPVGAANDSGEDDEHGGRDEDMKDSGVKDPEARGGKTKKDTSKKDTLAATSARGQHSMGHTKLGGCDSCREGVYMNGSMDQDPAPPRMDIAAAALAHLDRLRVELLPAGVEVEDLPAELVEMVALASKHGLEVEELPTDPTYEEILSSIITIRDNLIHSAIYRQRAQFEQAEQATATSSAVKR